VPDTHNHSVVHYKKVIRGKDCFQAQPYIMKHRSGNYEQIINALKHKKGRIKIGSAGLEKNCSVQDKNQWKAKRDQGPPEYLVGYVFK
jgi:hypothetical protein